MQEECLLFHAKQSGYCLLLQLLRYRAFEKVNSIDICSPICNLPASVHLFAIISRYIRRGKHAWEEACVFII